VVTVADFERRWLDRLASGAKVLSRAGEPGETAFTHASIADEFVNSLGLKPIGFNWELLDASAPADGVRSALGEMAKALGSDLHNPSKQWLAPDQATHCARDFLDMFDRNDLTVVSNRYDGLWNPIAGGEVEWGFVSFDRQRIALLLLVAQ